MMCIREISRRRRFGLRLQLLGAVCLAFPAIVWAQGAAIGVRVGSLGFGADVGVTIGERFGVRAGLNAFSFSFDGEEDDIDYDFDADLRTAALLADLYFSRIGFRITAGAMINGNEAVMLAVLTDDVEIGGQTYTKEVVGNMTGGVTFKDVGPYVGLGLDTSFGKRKAVGFVVEIGALFHGAPGVSFEVDGPIRDDPDFQADLERERSDVEGDLSDFSVYPVAALGISYRF